MIDFALGVPDAFYQSNNGFINAVSEEIYGYAQDNWKVDSDLTVNYGVAWDVEAEHEPPGRRHRHYLLGQQQQYLFSVSGSAPGLSWPGDPGCNSAGGVATHYNRFGPRVGFAWSPSSGPSQLIGAPGAHNLSIRAGFGLYYNRDQEEQSLQNLEIPRSSMFPTAPATWAQPFLCCTLH